MATVEYDFFSVVSPLNPGAVIGVTWSHPSSTTAMRSL